MTLKIGVDWGGTKLEVAALNGAGKIIWRRRRPTPQQDYGACIQAVKDLVLQAEAGLGGKGSVGIGIPGTLSPATGHVKNANSTWLNGRPLDKDMSRALQRPVRFANDANCLAVSEAHDGAGKGLACVFAVIIGTGVGGGIAIQSRPYVGSSGICGEWGHTPLPWPKPDELPGQQCWCGQSGCLEGYLSGPGLARDYFLISGETLSAERVIAKLHAKEQHARTCQQRYRDRLARGLAVVTNILDPDIIVLGGGLSNVGELYDGLTEKMSDYVFTDVFTTPIVKAKYGDSSGVRGAAWLWE